MGKGLIVAVVLVLIALFVFGQYVSVRNTLVTKNEVRKSRMVAGGHRVAASRGPHPQPGRDR